MQITHFDIAGLVAFTPDRFEDARGAFSETYSRRALAPVLGDITFVQDNCSLSRHAGTVRGLHFQAPPMAQAKLVRVLKGAILDVAVDLRAASPTYGRHIAVELSGANRAQLFVPRGFLHGFCTLTDDTEVLYKVDQYYSPEHDRTVRWSDPDLAIAWPVAAEGAVLSDKDARAPLLREMPAYFSAEGA